MATESQDAEWQLLHERLRGIAKRRSALDAEEARYLREADGSRLWRRFGYVHMNEYLERELGYGPQVGTERLRIAHALAELPRIEAGLAEGALPYSAVRELTRVATRETERAWLDKVRGKSLRQIEALVSGRKPGDGPEDPTNPDLETRVVRLELAPAVFALLRQVQSAMADEHGGRLDDSALMEILCRQALEGGGRSERPAYQIAITVCESCDRGWQNGAGREIEVGPEVIERARCDAELLGSLTAAQPARVTTTVTPRLRRQVLARDHHRCTAPGCRSARNLDLHHIEYQRDGSEHELWNITVLCSGHHQQLHDGALVIRGKAPDALEFVWREPRGDGAGTAAIDRDAREALLAAGYKPREARAAVEHARPHVGADATLEQVIREALRCCAVPGGLGGLQAHDGSDVVHHHS
jgi:RuvA, C-terminal domain